MNLALIPESGPLIGFCAPTRYAAKSSIAGT
jgi:hypothetical protein